MTITNYERLKEKVFRQDKIIANLLIRMQEAENRVNRIAEHPMLHIKEKE